VSSQYAAEPLPFDLNPVLAEYLDRQFQAIEVALRSDFQAPRFKELPERKVIGAVIVIRNEKDPSEDGFWACIENSQGVGEWKKLVLA
jgi:hypothetical protein